MLVFRCDGCKHEHRQVTKLGKAGIHTLTIPPNWQLRYHSTEKRDYFACSDTCARKILKTYFHDVPERKKSAVGISTSLGKGEQG